MNKYEQLEDSIALIKDKKVQTVCNNCLQAGELLILKFYIQGVIDGLSVEKTSIHILEDIKKLV